MHGGHLAVKPGYRNPVARADNRAKVVGHALAAVWCPRIDNVPTALDLCVPCQIATCEEPRYVGPRLPVGEAPIPPRHATPDDIHAADPGREPYCSSLSHMGSVAMGAAHSTGLKVAAGDR